MIPTRIQCAFGLGNRVAAIAHALSWVSEIEFAWRINWQCNATHQQVFPHGIPGVTFVDDAPSGFTSRLHGTRVHLWGAGQDPDSVASTYKVVMNALLGDAVEPPEAAIIARLHRFRVDPLEAAISMADAAAREGISGVFVLSDSHRQLIARVLTERGIKVVLPLHPEMGFEQDRTPERLAAFCPDWKTSLSAGKIISVGGVSTLLYPAMADGKQVFLPSPATPGPQRCGHG